MTFKVVVLYVLFWIVLSERISLESITVGTLICVGITYINVKFSLIKGEKQKNSIKISKYKYLIIYVLILIKEIVLANIEVAKVVLNPKAKISSVTTTITTRLSADFYKTMLANSITLTPGTITIKIEGDRLTVHCLKKEYIDGLVNSKFEQILLKAEEVK
jgi:multicomponent Na+:H+ antiporter subunit E